MREKIKHIDSFQWERDDKMAKRVYGTKIGWLGTILLFLAFSYALITFVIVPDMKRYSETKTGIELLKKEIDEILQKKAELDEDLIEYGDSEKNSVLKRDVPDRKEIEETLGKFGRNVEVQMQKEKKNTIFYNISMDIEKPAKFYEIFDFIKKEKLPMKIGYPVKFEKKYDMIEVEFTLEIRSLSG